MTRLGVTDMNACAYLGTWIGGSRPYSGRATPSLNLKIITNRGCYHSPNLKRVTRTDHQAYYGARWTFMGISSPTNTAAKES